LKLKLSSITEVGMQSVHCSGPATRLMHKEKTQC
jgi:hypothetical protein